MCTPPLTEYQNMINFIKYINYPIEVIGNCRINYSDKTSWAFTFLLYNRDKAGVVSIAKGGGQHMELQAIDKSWDKRKLRDNFRKRFRKIRRKHEESDKK